MCGIRLSLILRAVKEKEKERKQAYMQHKMKRNERLLINDEYLFSVQVMDLHLR